MGINRMELRLDFKCEFVAFVVENQQLVTKVLCTSIISVKTRTCRGGEGVLRQRKGREIPTEKPGSPSLPLSVKNT